MRGVQPGPGLQGFTASSGLIRNDASLNAEDVALGYEQLLRVEESVRRPEHGIEIRREPGRLEMVAYSGGDRRAIEEPDHFPSTRPVPGQSSPIPVATARLAWQHVIGRPGPGA